MADNGLPYTGSVALMARLYGAADGGTAVWSQDLGAVSVMGGVLQADLMGSELMAALAASSDLWLEFEIEGETLAPRQKLSSAPYAAVAGNAAMLGGVPAGSYLTGDALGDALQAGNLPTDGINQISNGSLRNEFMDVLHEWANGPVDIPDYHPSNPGLNAMATVDTAEGEGSYLTGITIYTGFTLGVLSDITVRLFPPAGAGVSEIVLQSAVLTPGGSPYNASWTVQNTPALANLLGKQVAGTWVLTITDNDDTVTLNNPVGQLTDFAITYDVVRANHLMVDGRLDVHGDANISGDLNVAGTVRVGSGLSCQGEADSGRLRWHEGELQSCDGAQWAHVSPLSGRLAYHHYQFDAAARSFSTSWDVGMVWSEHQLPGNTVVQVNLHVATYNGTTTWGGCYNAIEVRINEGSWEPLGDSGYDSSMITGGAHHDSKHYSFHYDPQQTEPYTLQFRTQHRAYSGTCQINQNSITVGSTGFGASNLGLLVFHK